MHTRLFVIQLAVFVLSMSGFTSAAHAAEWYDRLPANGQYVPPPEEGTYTPPQDFQDLNANATDKPIGSSDNAIIDEADPGQRVIVEEGSSGQATDTANPISASSRGVMWIVITLVVLALLGYGGYRMWRSSKTL